jgi:hypothetical protein
LAFAQERATAAKDDAVALTKRIESDAPKKDLLESANSTVAAVEQLYDATQAGTTAMIADRAGIARARIARLMVGHGDISKEYGNVLIGTLRKTYGPSFARGFTDLAMLSEVLHKLDEPSLHKLVQDYDAGRLHEITRQGL